jgi:hypothetical protein
MIWFLEALGVTLTWRMICFPMGIPDHERHSSDPDD